MPGIAPRLSEREERIRSLLHFFRNVNRSTSNSASNFPPLSNDVVELIDATRSVWLDIDDFESWLNEARAPTVLRDILSNAAWEDTTETLSMRSLELIIQSLLIVQGSGLSLRSRDCLVANCHNPVEENYTRQSEFQTVEINVNLQRSGGHWCVGSLPIYPVVRPHRNSRLCREHMNMFRRRILSTFHERRELVALLVARLRMYLLRHAQIQFNHEASFGQDIHELVSNRVGNLGIADRLSRHPY